MTDGVARTDTPAHLRPCGGVRAASLRRERGVSAPVPPEVEPGVIRLTLRIPRGTKRVVILSNVTAGFSPADVPLAPGDLVIHCNQSRHRVAAMAVEGTRHWLFVRHGKGRDPRGLHWYHDGTFDGFERVIFINDRDFLRQFRWFGEFRALTRKSPTTGFILANVFREIAPEMPLVLAGFDPGTQHGTTMWRGHDWGVEDVWYAQRGFFQVRPGGAVRILVLVTSCRAYRRRERRAASAEGCAAKRRVVRETWMRHLPDGMQAFFFVGAGCDGVEVAAPDVWALDAPDDYPGLPQKVLAAFRRAMEIPGWDYVFKCDDDTFLRPERLGSLAVGRPAAVAHFPFASRPFSGGAGYLLRRDTVAAVVAHPELYPPSGNEDHVLCAALAHLGIPVTPTNALSYDSRFGVPSPSNTKTSVAQLTPAAMLALFYTNYTP